MLLFGKPNFNKLVTGVADMQPKNILWTGSSSTIDNMKSMYEGISKIFSKKYTNGK